MADHYSGPRILSDPAADITDLFAFPSPTRAGYLVLVLNVFPSAVPTALFSDALTYRLRVRSLTSAGSGATARFIPADDEYTFDFTFTQPTSPPSGSDTLTQKGLCVAAGGERVDFLVGEEASDQSGRLRIFTGPRLDPFFMDLVGAATTEQLEKLSFKPDATNSLDGANVLSIVLELDSVSVFGSDVGSLLAVVGETVTRGGHPFRLERMGRPEIKNVVMAGKKFDNVNKDLEIRDLYNEEDAFSVRSEYEGAYRARLNANLCFLDQLDGTTNWMLVEGGTHPLTELLLADFLVVDQGKPFCEDGWFEIETALIAGHPHTTCGGRSLNDDIVDTLYTVLVGGIDGDRIRDGVDQATQPATRTFPYLRPPSANPTDLLAVLAARLTPVEGSAS